MTVVIKKISISEIVDEPTSAPLLTEYARESAIEGLPPPSAKIDLYKQIEDKGILHSFGAFLDGAMVGFITVLTSVLPHYSALVSTSESFFVSKAHRGTGAGLKLLRAAESFAKEAGSKGLLVCAPTGSTLATVLEGIGYHETNRVFFRGIA